MLEEKEEKNFDLVYDMKKMYLAIYEITNRYLNNYYNDLKKRRIIDIRGIVKKHGIDIIEKEIYSKKFFFINQLDGYLDSIPQNGQLKYTIYVNENLDEASKRYVIAHEFSHYILENKCEKNTDTWELRENQYCLNVLFPRNAEESICDIMTAFLLMPIDCVLPLMKQFVDSRSGGYPVRMNEWLQCLSYWLQVSSYHVNICFQHIRYLATFLYNKYHKESDGEVFCGSIGEYKNLFF